MNEGEDPQIYFLPLLHPAHIQRGMWHKEPAQITYLSRVARCVRGVISPPAIDVNNPPPGTLLFPTPTQAKAFYEETLEGWGAVSMDIEAAGPFLICIGFTQLSLETGTVGRTICCRILRRYGQQAHDKNRLYQMIDWIDKILSDPRITLIAHNGISFDFPMLKRLGFELNGRIIDTMVLGHTAYSEFPKGLQWMATLYLWAPVWKILVEEKDEMDGKA